MSKRQRHARRAVAAFAVLLGGALAGCGSSSPSSASEGSGAAKQLPTITIDTGAITSDFMQPHIAEALGYFKQLGVNVKLRNNTSAQALNDVILGSADLGMGAAGNPLLGAQRGRDVQIVYVPQSGASAGMLVGGPDVTSVDQLKGKRIGTLTRGSSSYGIAYRYSDKLGLKADIVPFSEPATLTAALAAGKIAAGVCPFDAFSSLLASGKGHILVDVRNAQTRHTTLGQDYPEGSVFGLKSNLDKKHDAIVKVLEAYQMALNYIRTHSTQEIAATLRKESDWTQFTEAQLSSSVATASNFVGINDGSIPQSIWSYSVQQYATYWKLGDFSASDPKYAYDSLVNMTFLDEADKAVKLQPARSTTA
jgi:NitT/TauT family transport system substrate-binding protein